MLKLLYKEFNLSISRFYIVIPFLTGALFLIPKWPFFVALMYFFFISVPNILSSFNTQNDYTFTIMMPVKKSDIVKSKISAFIILELLHIIAGVFYAYLNTVIYRSDNFMLDPNAAFFGIAFSMFGLFNIIMFPMYFKTAYNFGFPTVISSVIIVLYIFGIEILAIVNDNLRLLLEGDSKTQIAVQYGILGAGILIFILLSYISLRISSKRFEKINL